MKNFEIEQSAPLLTALVAWTRNRTQAKQWLRLRQVLVNGTVADRHDLLLQPGDKVEIGKASAYGRTDATGRVPQPRRRGGQVLGLPLVYEDESLLVIDKPHGLLTMATDSDRDRTAYHEIYEYVKRSSKRPGDRIFIVHRLDRETSGLLVFARTEQAKQQLQAAWETVEKHYFAIVEGLPTTQAATLVSHLTESKALRVYAGPETAQSKRAVTHYRVIKTSRSRALLDVVLETGRKHQIRVHLADAGFPVVGDDKYGKHRGPGRLALHATTAQAASPGDGRDPRLSQPAAAQHVGTA